MLGCIDGKLVIFAIFVSRLEVFYSVPHCVLEKVPGVGLFEAWHAENVPRKPSVDEELQCEGGEKTFGVFSQVRGLREANQAVRGDLICRIVASVIMGIVSGGNPRDFCDKALSMNRLEAILWHLIGFRAIEAIL